MRFASTCSALQLDTGMRVLKAISDSLSRASLEMILERNRAEKPGNYWSWHRHALQQRRSFLLQARDILLSGTCLGVAVALVDGRVRRQEVVVAPAINVPHKHALPPL